MKKMMRILYPMKTFKEKSMEFKQKYHSWNRKLKPMNQKKNSPNKIISSTMLWIHSQPFLQAKRMLLYTNQLLHPHLFKMKKQILLFIQKICEDSVAKKQDLSTEGLLLQKKQSNNNNKIPMVMHLHLKTLLKEEGLMLQIDRRFKFQETEKEMRLTKNKSKKRRRNLIPRRITQRKT